jgi:hypothetical protein
VNNFVGEYCLNWGLTEAVIRDLVQQSLYEFLFINQNCSDIKGKHRDAGSVKTSIHTFFVDVSLDYARPRTFS